MYSSEPVCINQDVEMKWPGAARNKVTGKWRKLHSEELHDLYCSLDTIRVMKPRRIRWAGQVARMEGDVHIIYWSGNMRKRSHLEEVGIDGWIILN
jgi:hypothetical protein